MSFLALSAGCVGAIVFVMALAAAIGHRIGRVNVIDVAWGVMFVAAAIVATILGTASSPRRWIILGMVTVWGLRLSIYLALKTAGRGEDPRFRRDRHPLPSGNDLFACFRKRREIAGALDVKATGIRPLHATDELPCPAASQKDEDRLISAGSVFVDRCEARRNRSWSYLVALMS